MTDERWKQVETLFRQALEREPHERDAYLDRVCAGDEALRGEVESLLEHAENAGSFIEKPVIGGTQILVGRTLGSYRILESIGKGGMGEVWKALDTKLGREVAIKTLPEEFAKDEERLARFEREARLLASLNHPNIAAIHGFEEDNGTHFLVLEFVDGNTVADRLKRGAIPIEESLKLALQIAEALEAAHEKGIIHRDLKPANIKVTDDGKVKLLDFGLAKALWGEGLNVDLSKLPTISEIPTAEGQMVGTPGYMSPEQARGKPVDRRADIWALGCVFYEVLTGRQTWGGETVTDMIAAALTREPDWSPLPENLNRKVQELLRRCLEKEPNERWQAVADVRFEIANLLADPDGLLVREEATVLQPQAKLRLVLPWVVTAVVLTALLASIAVWNLTPSEPRVITRFDYDLPEAQQFRRPWASLLAVSPDGSQFVYVANRQLYLRSMDELEAHPIPGTDERPFGPFFSPDGQWVGYGSGADRQLKKISISGGAPVVLCDFTSPFFGASWGVDDTILFHQPEGIMRVSANGGTPELLVATEEGEQFDGPQLLPNEVVLFTRTSTAGPTRWDEAQVVVESLDTGERKLLWNGGSDAQYVPTGHLVYAFEDVLFAIPFDLASLEVTGEPVSIVEGVQRTTYPMFWTGTAHYSFSDDGTLTYVSGGASGVERSVERSLVWVDRQGQEELIDLPPQPYASPRVSPNGGRVVFHVESSGNTDVWVYDLVRASSTRLTRQQIDRFPIWTPDGSRVVFSRHGDDGGLFWTAADGTGDIERLTASSTSMAYVWTSDGTELIFTDVDLVTGNNDIRLLSLDGDPDGEGLLADPLFNEGRPTLSPDDRWIAYRSDESGRDQVYVRPFPNVDDRRWTISIDGGTEVLWGKGEELFYRPARGPLMLVTVEGNDNPSFGNPRPLFDDEYYRGGGRNYDIAPDGQRFLMIKDAAAEDGSQTRRIGC